MNPYITMPSIIKESSDGISYCPIPDELFTRYRSIEAAGEITPESAQALILQLRYLSLADPEAEITMYINSPGGSVRDGLAVYDVMAGISCPVRTVCTGIAASMAALLFAAGSHRDILPHGTVMIHDPLTTGMGGSALHMEEAAKRLMETRRTIAGLLAGYTGHSMDEVLGKTKDDTYFNAEEAVEWHLADRIITKL